MRDGCVFQGFGILLVGNPGGQKYEAIKKLDDPVYTDHCRGFSGKAFLVSTLDRQTIFSIDG
jgi:hypothetical protein